MRKVGRRRQDRRGLRHGKGWAAVLQTCCPLSVDHFVLRLTFHLGRQQGIAHEGGKEVKGWVLLRMTTNVRKLEVRSPPCPLLKFQIAGTQGFLK